MFYATWSKGFRPGGINRQPLAGPYAPDFLVNYEFGWKTTFMGNRLRWNGAIYRQDWSDIQYSFLGLNSLTVIQNGRDAQIKGIEIGHQLCGGRADAQCRCRLHQRQDEGEHL